MASLPPLLGLLPANPTVPEMLSFQLTGLLIVFLALGSIWFALEIIGRIFRYLEKRPAPGPAAPPTAAPAAAAPAPAPAPGVPAEVLAAIAAAVHVTLGPGGRVAAVRSIPTDQDWAREGRRQIFASHRLR
jgi:Na+-transporting methylmalonyl-CoA/oxaloacetate decarboxylase gamma subunit